MVKSYIGIKGNIDYGSREGTYRRYPYGFPVISTGNGHRWYKFGLRFVRSEFDSNGIY